MDLTKGKILVTGADGFIGSHLVEALVKRGCDVRTMVYYNSFNSWGWLDHSSAEVKQNIEVIAGDVRDAHGMQSIVRGCDVVFHLAALIAIPYSYHSPASYVDTNIHGTLNVVQAARESGVSKVVHTSTSEVYGSAQYVPINELHPLQGQSPYSASKIAADHMAMSFYTSFATPVSIIRPFNTYGPRQSARAVIPTIISQLASGQSQIKLGALTPTRDFNYVADTVEGFIAIAQADNTIGEVINIGSNYEIAIGDLAKTIANTMNKSCEIVCDQQRLRPDKSEVDRLWACNQKANQLLQWRPKFAGINGLTKGLMETIEWFLNPGNLKLYKSGVYNI